MPEIETGTAGDAMLAIMLANIDHAMSTTDEAPAVFKVTPAELSTWADAVQEYETARFTSGGNRMPDEPEYLTQFFTYDHLTSPELRSTSALFANLAQRLIFDLPKNPERTVALRKLLEAKDAAVRTHLVK